MTDATPTITKEVRQAFGKTVYKLGRFKDGYTFWLEEPEWECGWYWGLGYVRTYTRKEGPPAKDIQSHQHYKGLLFKTPEVYNAEKQCFQLSHGTYLHILSDDADVAECVLTKTEQWILSDLMQSAYTLKEMAEVYGRGYSYLTENALEPTIHQPETAKRINEVELPAIFKRIAELLTPKEG